MGFEGILLWAGETAGVREVLAATAAEFGLEAEFCRPEELPGVLQGRALDLIGIELGADAARRLALVQQLHRRFPRLTILAAAADAGVASIQAALEAGANDFLSLPLAPQELRKALIRSAQARLDPSASREGDGDVVTIYGARGGLGATTLAVNLAFRLHGMTGAEVAVVDLDIQRGDVATFLNLSPVNSLGALAAAPGRVDDAFLAGTLTRHPDGVSVLTAPPGIEEAETIGHAEVSLALRLLRRQFAQTIVDTARTITGATLAAFEESQRILVLTDLSVPGVRAAHRVVELLLRLNTPSERVEWLVAEAVPGPVPLVDAVRAIGREPLHVIPREAATVRSAINEGTPLNGNKSALTASLTELAAKLTGLPAPAKPVAGPLLRRLFGRGGRAHT